MGRCSFITELYRESPQRAQRLKTPRAKTRNCARGQTFLSPPPPVAALRCATTHNAHCSSTKFTLAWADDYKFRYVQIAFFGNCIRAAGTPHRFHCHMVHSPSRCGSPPAWSRLFTDRHCERQHSSFSERLTRTYAQLYPLQAMRLQADAVLQVRESSVYRLAATTRATRWERGYKLTNL